MSCFLSYQSCRLYSMSRHWVSYLYLVQYINLTSFQINHHVLWVEVWFHLWPNFQSDKRPLSFDSFSHQFIHHCGFRTVSKHIVNFDRGHCECLRYFVVVVKNSIAQSYNEKSQCHHERATKPYDCCSNI